MQEVLWTAEAVHWSADAASTTEGVEDQPGSAEADSQKKTSDDANSQQNK
jgi:hypothetical protein